MAFVSTRIRMEQGLSKEEIKKLRALAEKDKQEKDKELSEAKDKANASKKR